MAKVKVGLVARRSEAGDFLPGALIRRGVSDGRQNAEGLTEQEDRALTGLAKILAEQFIKHMESCREQETD